VACFRPVKPFLNIDAGEHDDEPDELYAIAHAVSIACGGHAGDERSMERVVRACVGSATRIGAHPSYEDREGFGRRELEIEATTIVESVREQCARLARIAEACGAKVAHVKAHGALYHAANRDPAIARALAVGAREAMGTVVVLGPPEGELRRAAGEAGLPFASEGFADRAMRADGSLVPRGEPGAVIADLDAVRAQTRTLVASGAYDTLCVHGDSPGALEIARAVRQVLDA
jgi:UPF0271 protein